MAISMDLRVLARKLEKSSDDLLINASTKGKDTFEKAATAVAAASTLLEGVADDMDANADFSITPEQLDELAILATAFDESNDPLLKKQASVIDELLLSIAAPKNAALTSRKVTEDEVNRLREERRRATGEDAYTKPGKELGEMWNAKAQAKAVEQQVKRFVPMEAPLQTRYPPDRPGGQMTRITDHVYQDVLTGIIYDYKAGYKTQKGNEIPGSSVENQTRQLNDSRDQGASLFETRDSLMGRYASDLNHIKKYALENEISEALRGVRDQVPALMDAALDKAYDDGLSTTDVANILSNTTKASGDIETLLTNAGWESILVKSDVSRASLVALAINSIQELAPHLLKSGVDKAKKEGLSDDQIKSIIAGGFSNFKQSSFSPAGEVKAAESFFPMLRDLGWNDLIDKHLNVIAKLGVPQNVIHKLSGKNISKKSSLEDLKNALRKTVADEIEIGLSKKGGPLPAIPDLFGDEVPPPHVMNPLLEKEEQEPKTVRVPPSAELIEKLKGIVPSEDMEEPPQSEPSPELAPESESDFFSMMFPSTRAPAPKSLITPVIDQDTWNNVYAASKEAIINNQDVKRQMAELRNTENGRELVNTRVKELINEEMHKQNCVGAYELDENGDEWFIVSAEITRTRPRTAPPPPSTVEEEGEKEPDDSPAATNDGKELPWEQYQAKNKVTVSENLAKEIESKWSELYQGSIAKYENIFKDYSFAGDKVPASVEKLPKEVKQWLMAMYLRGEVTEAMYEELKRELPKIVAKDMPGAPEREIIEVSEKMIPPVLDLKVARRAMLGSENRRLAEELLKKAKSSSRVAAINLILQSKELPLMYPKAELLTRKQFQEQMEALGYTKKTKELNRLRSAVEGKTRKKDKNVLIHPVPEDEKGEKLVSLVDDPDRYIEGLGLAIEAYPYPYKPVPPEIKQKRDEFMKQHGLVPPSYVLYGTGGTTYSMLMGFVNKLDELGDSPFPNFHGLKNLFENPDEYAAHWLKGKEKFDHLYNREAPPREFDQIHGGAPEIVKNVPISIQQEIKKLFESKPKDEDGRPLNSEEKLQYAINQMRDSGVDPATITKVWESLKKSGKAVKAEIQRLIGKEMSPYEIYEAIEKRYPDAYVPKGLIEGVYNFFKKKKAHNEKVTQEWNKWSQTEGFYPPHWITVGKQTSAGLLSPGGRSGDWDRFGGWSLSGE